MCNRALVALSVLAACAGGGESREGSAVVAERRAETESAPEPAPEPRGLLVRVIDASTGEPVIGADVGYCDDFLLPRGFAERLAPYAMGDLRDAMRRFGVWSRTDANGETRVPWSGTRRRCCITAEADGRSGITNVPEGKPWALEPRVLAIDVPGSFPVRVEDRVRNPIAGVPVELRVRTRYADELLLRVPTGPDGVARLPDCARTWATGTGGNDLFFESEAWGSFAICSVAVPLLGLDPDGVRYSEWEPMAQVVRTLPAHGRVVVDVSTWERRAATPIHVVLRAGTRAEVATLDLSAPCPGARYAVAGPDGLTTFDFVPTGLQLVVGAWTDGMPEFARGCLLGPKQESEAVRIALAARQDPMLRGRLLDEQGQRLANCVLWLRDDLQRDGRGGGSLEIRIETDADGCWSTSVLPGESNERRTIRIAPLGSAARPVAELTLPRVLRPGMVVELGDAVLRAPMLLAEGVVIDSDNRPLPNVHVSCSMEAGLVEESAYACTARDGRFELRYACESPRVSVRLLARGAGYATLQSDPFEPGTRGIRLHMVQRTGDVTVPVVYSGEQVPKHLHAQLRPQRGYALPGHWLPASSDAPLRLRWVGLDPGRYEIEVLARGRRALPVEYAIDVSPGRRGDEPAPELDLWYRMDGCYFRPRDVAGRAVLELIAEVTYPDGSVRTHLRAQNGFAQLAMERSWQRVTLSAPGLALWQTESQPLPGDVVFARGPAIRVELVDAPALPEGLRYLVRTGGFDMFGYPATLLESQAYCDLAGHAWLFAQRPRAKSVQVFVVPPAGWPRHDEPVGETAVDWSGSGETGAARVAVRADIVQQLLPRWEAWK